MKRGELTSIHRGLLEVSPEIQKSGEAKFACEARGFADLVGASQALAQRCWARNGRIVPWPFVLFNQKSLELFVL